MQLKRHEENILIPKFNMFLKYTYVQKVFDFYFLLLLMQQNYFVFKW